jgi:hypothetical protein
MNRFRTSICLGIAIDEYGMIQVAAVEANELTTPWPLELRGFPDLESFDAYWFEWLEPQYGIERVGLTFVGLDDLGVADWLEEQGIAREIFEVPAFTFCLEAEQHKVPGLFGAAYSQALACLLRTRASHFTALAAAKVRKLDHDLKTLLAQLESLQAALACREHCPF